MSSLSIVIPTYKKTGMLLRNLEKNLTYFENNEVIIINDDPSSSLTTQLKKFPQIKLKELPVNRGFAGAIHAGIMAATGKYVMLLNSDVILHDTSYKKAVKRLQQHSDIFAIAFAQKESNGVIGGKNRLFWKNGFILHDRATDISEGQNGWAEGGACLFEKQKYVSLGGFRHIYSPFYWEDIDLSYRAQKAGYAIWFDPEIQVDHQHESTIGSLFQKKYIQEVAYRNQILCVWLNIRDASLLLQHVIYLARMIARSIIGDRIFFIAFLKAVMRILTIHETRGELQNVHSDYAILEKK